jgi:hypothetical protein
MRAVLFPTVARTCRAVLVRAAARHPASRPAQARMSRRPLSAAADGLLDILAREHDEEVANQSAEMPDEVSDLVKTLEARQWEIVEEGATTRLLQTLPAGQVQVVFHCQDTVPEEDEGYDEEDDVEPEQQDEEAPTLRFTVTVTKADNTMVFVCLSQNASCTIESVTMTQTDVALLANGVPAAEYQGPEFTELAADLQDALEQFLADDIGIDADVAAFVSMFADYQEQRQYVGFLEQAKRLLS